MRRFARLPLCFCALPGIASAIAFPGRQKQFVGNLIAFSERTAYFCMTIPKVRYLILPKMKKWLLMVLLFPLCCTLQARLHAEAGTGAGCRSQAASVLYGTLPQRVAAFTTDFKNMPAGGTDARPASPRLSVPDMHPAGGEAAIPGGLACWAWVLCAVVLLAVVAMLVRLAVLKIFLKHRRQFIIRTHLFILPDSVFSNQV